LYLSGTPEELRKLKSLTVHARTGSFDYVEWLEWLLEGDNAKSVGLKLVTEFEVKDISSEMRRVLREYERVFFKYLNDGSEKAVELPGGGRIEVDAVANWVQFALLGQTRLCLDFESCQSGCFLEQVVDEVGGTPETLGQWVTLIAWVSDGSIFTSKFVFKDGEWSVFVGPCLRCELRYLSYLAGSGDSFEAMAEEINGLGYVGFRMEVRGNPGKVVDFLPLGRISWEVLRRVGLRLPPPCELPLKPVWDDRLVLRKAKDEEEALRGVVAPQRAGESPVFISAPMKVMKRFEAGELLAAARVPIEAEADIGEVMLELERRHPDWFRHEKQLPALEESTERELRKSVNSILREYRTGGHWLAISSAWLPLLYNGTLSVDEIREEMRRIAVKQRGWRMRIIRWLKGEVD
jgi:hypothetical protein